MNKGYASTLAIAKAVRRYVASLNVLYVISSVLLVWVVVWIASFGDMPDDWNQAVLQQSLQNGSFWLLPGHVLFQDSTEIGGNNMPFAVFMAVLIISLVVWGYVSLQFRIVGWLAQMVTYRFSSLVKKTTKPIAVTSSVSQLFPRISSKPTWAVEAKEYTYTAALEGRSLILSTMLPVAVPSLFFDSVKNDIAKREGRRLQFSHETMLVLDGVMYEHFKLHAPAETHVALAHALKTDTIALVTKELDSVEISTEKNVFVAVIDVRNLHGDKDMERILDALTKLANKLVDIAKTVSVEHELQPKRVESTAMFLGVWQLSTISVAIISLSIAMMFVAMAEAVGGSAHIGDAILPVAIIGIFLLTRVYRRMKHAAGVQLGKGIL